MTKHLRRDLEHLKKEILGVGSLVENAINLATTDLLDRRPELARQVVAGDQEIDPLENSEFGDARSKRHLKAVALEYRVHRYSYRMA